MTPEDIKKLPTRETDAAAFDWHPEDGVTYDPEGEFVDPDFARSLEQQRDALISLLEWLAPLVEKRYSEEIDETLASIRQMKEGK